MAWQRARNTEQKELRRNTILEAARKLIEEGQLEDAGINVIAREAGMSKANIYRYFESREAIFLEIVLDEFDAWNMRIEEALEPLTESGQTKAISEALVDSLLQSPRLQQLIPHICQVLERNVSAETATLFKTEMKKTNRRAANALKATLPRVSIADIKTFLDGMVFLIAGMVPAANPSPAMAQALDSPGLNTQKVTLQGDLKRLIHTLLRGIQNAD